MAVSILVGLIWALLCSASASAADAIVDEQRGFSFEVPVGFEPAPQLVDPGSGLVYAFINGDPTDDLPDLVLMVEMLGGTIGREPMTADHFPEGFQGRIVRKEWRGFTVDGIEFIQTQNGVDLHTVAVQIPIEREAIQIIGGGVVERSAEINQAVDQLLASLRGESNWLRSVVPSAEVTSSKSYSWVLLGGSLALVAGGLALLWYIRRKTPKGTVFALALMLFFISVCFVDRDVRELMALKGAMRMLSLLGIIYGVYDLAKTRKPCPIPKLEEPYNGEEPDADVSAQ
jgi:hypothetical protein